MVRGHPYEGVRICGDHPAVLWPNEADATPIARDVASCAHCEDPIFEIAEHPPTVPPGPEYFCKRCGPLRREACCGGVRFVPVDQTDEPAPVPREDGYIAVPVSYRQVRFDPVAKELDASVVRRLWFLRRMAYAAVGLAVMLLLAVAWFGFNVAGAVR